MLSLATIRSAAKRFYQSGGSDIVSDIDANFNALNQAIAQKTVITVGTSTGADYVCDGTADDVQIQAAVNALPATGGRLMIKAGTYNINARISIISKSDFIIEGESSATVIKAAQSIYTGGSEHHFGMFNVNNHTAPIKNIIFRNLVIDANNKLKTQCMTITGGTTESTAGTTNVLLDNVVFKNMGQDASDTSRGSVEIISGNMFFGNYGRVDQIHLRNCEFDSSQYYHIYLLGNFIKNLKIENCYFHGNQSHTISFFQYGYQTGKTSHPRSHENWEISGCRFEDTKQRTTTQSVCDLHDENRTGIKNIRIHHNYFSPRYNDDNDDEININLHGAWGVEIKDNFFDEVGEAISLGQSNAASYYRIDPMLMTTIESNIFYKVRMTCFDNDSNIFTVMRNNHFYYCANQALGSYSRHFPTTYEGNVFYNCSASYFDAEEYRKAAIMVNGDGFIVRNNYFIDDRLLVDPVSVPTLSQVSGGALSSRTYYVKYTWANDTGETLASSQATLAVNANNLLRVTFSTTNTYPSGATRINIYASTTSGSETLQGYLDIAYQNEAGEADWSALSWTEPTTGLVSGAILPVLNTTATKMKYGIYEIGGGLSTTLANHYYNNHFYGIETPISTNSLYTRVRHDNYSNSSLNSGNEVNLEKQPYTQGNVTGSTTFNIKNGEYITATLTGNITVTLSNGDYSGQELILKLTQDGTGSRTATWPSNLKKAGGSLTLSTTAGAIDIIRMRFDGTNWNEVSRSLNLS